MKKIYVHRVAWYPQTSQKYIHAPVVTSAKFKIDRIISERLCTPPKNRLIFSHACAFVPNLQSFTKRSELDLDQFVFQLRCATRPHVFTQGASRRRAINNGEFGALVHALPFLEFQCARRRVCRVHVFLYMCVCAPRTSGEKVGARFHAYRNFVWTIRASIEWGWTGSAYFTKKKRDRRWVCVFRYDERIFFTRQLVFEVFLGNVGKR